MRESMLCHLSPVYMYGMYMFKVTCVYLHTGKHACMHTQINTHALVHMHTAVACPTQQSVICVWLLSYIFLCLCWLVAQLRKSYRRRRQTVLCSNLGRMSRLFPATAWPQDAAQSKKKESRGLWLPSRPGSWLVSSVTPEKNPPELFKTAQPLKTTTWPWTPELCLNWDSKELLFLIDTKGHWCFRILGIVMVLTVQLTLHLFCWTYKKLVAVMRCL